MAQSLLLYGCRKESSIIIRHRRDVAMKISREWLAQLPQMTIGSAVQRAVEKAQYHPFLFFYDSVYTYKDMGEGIDLWREALCGHGFEEGNRAVIFAENSPYWCMVFLAIVSAGGVAVPLDTHLSGAPLKLLIERSEAHIVFTSSMCLEHVMAIIDELPNVRHVVVMDGNGKGNPRPIAREDFLVQRRNNTKAMTGPDDVCTILFTSGTTGEPKAVPLTHRNLLSGVAMSARLASLRQNDCFLNPLPLYHIFPMVAGFLTPLSCGISLSLTNRVDRGDLNNAVTHHPVTLLLCVPAFYEIMAQRIQKNIDALKGFKAKLVKWLMKSDAVKSSPLFLGWLKRRVLAKGLGQWGKLRLYVSGGAPLNHDILHTFFLLGLPLMEGYGLTETCGGVIVNTYRYHLVGSVGKLFTKWVEVRIDKPADDGIGEVLLRGPTITNGYLGLPREESFTEDNFFRTGDLGFVDNKGFLHITGRLKDVIVPASGKNIYPVELEAHYKRSLLIQDICIFGLPEKGKKSETVHASVIVTDQLLAHGEETAYEWLATEIDKLSSELPAYKRVKSFNIWRGDFPRVGTGKVKKFEVRESVIRIMQGGEEPIVTVDDELLMTHPEAKFLCDLLLELAPRKVPLFPETLLSVDLGLDSLRTTELILRLERQYNLTFPVARLAEVRTVKDAIAFLEYSLNDAVPLEKGVMYADLRESI